MALVDLKDASIKIKGGGGEELDCEVGNGNVTWSEKRNIDYVLNRGLIDEVRAGDQAPVEVQLQVNWKYFSTSSGETTMQDAITGASGWDSSDADACRPYACDIEITLAPDCGIGQTITLNDFRYEDLQFNLKDASISVTGKCNIAHATIV